MEPVFGEGMAEERQPKGLAVLFLVEMCERFGFYTLLFLLALYLTGDLGMTDDRADLLYGAYTSFIYLAAVAGGFLADRVLGFRRAIIAGALISACGYALLAAGQDIHIALAILVAGGGLFKVNVTSLLGRLYGPRDGRREGGFALYYMGINAGSFTAGLSAGYVATTFGYGWAFAMAAGGVLLALTIFLLGPRFLQGEGMPPKDGRLFRQSPGGVFDAVFVGVGIAVTIAAVALLLLKPSMAGEVLAVLGALVLGLFFFEVRRAPVSDRQPLIALLVLFLFAVFFWAVYAQSGLSVILYIQRSVNRDVFGQTLSPTLFESLNPILILLTAPLFSWLWVRLARKHLNPSVPLKFVFGLALLAFAFFALKLGGMISGTVVAPAWPVAFFLLLTAGEMCVSPIGMSLVSRVAPSYLLGLTMGMWFLAEAIAYYVSGLIAQIASIPTGLSKAETELVYENAFFQFGLLAIAAALTLLPLVGFTRRLLARKDGDDPGEERAQ
jgi:POT family proton-dependent oligopeptide transporter